MNKARTDAWFTREIEAAGPTMFRIAFAILRNRTDCEDAAQNAILKAYRRLDTLSDRKLFRAWLIRILKNECINCTRANRSVIRLEACGDVGYDMEVPDLDLNRAFDTLTKDERLAVTLYYYEGYSTREIAQICDTTDGAIRTRLSRAREALRTRLSEQEAMS